jgi:3,4-dihydroxy-2-butanone 4-phosphate synthase
MSRREERLARNEAFFRELNERLEAVTPDSASGLVVVCECADEDCAQRLTLRQEEYEAIRAHDTYFVVAVGHVDSRIEHVVRQTDRFEVVAKRGAAADVAEDLDPRSAA